MFRRYIDKIKKASYAQGYLDGRNECTQCLKQMSHGTILEVTFDKDTAPYGKLCLGDETYSVYLGKEDFHILGVQSNGSVEHKRVFVLVEV